MKSLYRKLLIGGLIFLGSVIFLYYVGIAQYMSLENIKAQSAYLQMQVEKNYFWSVLAFLLFFTSLIGFTLPVTGPMGVMGGFLYGLWPSVLYCMFSVMVGTTISFLVVRHALSHVIRDQYKDQLATFSERVHQYGYGYLISLQLLTVVPYFVINTLAALAGVSLETFMWTTAAGSLPIIFIYSFAGKELYMIQSWKDILSIHMLALLLVLAALALLPMLMKKLRNSGW